MILLVAAVRNQPIENATHPNRAAITRQTTRAPAVRRSSLTKASSPSTTRQRWCIAVSRKLN